MVKKALPLDIEVTTQLELTSNNTYEEVASLILTDSIEDKNFKKSFSKYYLETTKDTKLNELLGEIKEKPASYGCCQDNCFVQG